MADGKPSFLSSVMSAIGGYVKGALAGGAVGVIGGAAIGAVVGLATGGVLPALAAGAYFGGVTLAGIGGLAGAVTEVVRNNAASKPDVGEMTNLAKASFAQGVAVGHNIEVAEQAETSRFRDQITRERATVAQSQQIH